MLVTKRDGRQVLFNVQKIENAIGKAYWDKDWSPDKPNPPYAGHIADKIFKSNQDYTVEQIQDLVERELMSYDPDVAKAYILYRNKRTRAREQQSRIINAVKSRLEARNVQNSNANVDERSFSGREKESQSDIHKIIALEDGSYLSEEVANAHKNMLLYQHDLEKAPVGEHNCLNIDFKKLFTEGFATRNGDIRVPTSYATACQQVAVIFQCQSQVQFGGVGSVHIDYDLTPFVRMSFAKHFLDGMEWLCDNGVEYDRNFICHTLQELVEYSAGYFEFVEELEKQGDWRYYIFKKICYGYVEKGDASECRSSLPQPQLPRIPCGVSGPVYLY